MDVASLLQSISSGAPSSEALYRGLLHWRDAVAWENSGDVVRVVPAGRVDVHCRETVEAARRRGHSAAVVLEEAIQAGLPPSLDLQGSLVFGGDRPSRHFEFVTATTTLPTDGFEVTRVKRLIPSGGVVESSVLCAGQLIRVDDYQITYLILPQRLSLEEKVSVIELRNVRADVDGLHIVETSDWDEEGERLIVGFRSDAPVYEPVEEKRKCHVIWEQSSSPLTATLTEKFRIESRALYHIVLHGVPEPMFELPQQEVLPQSAPWQLPQAEGSSCGSGSRVGSGSGISVRASSPGRKQRKDPPGFKTTPRPQTVQFSPPPLYDASQALPSAEPVPSQQPDYVLPTVSLEEPVVSQKPNYYSSAMPPAEPVVSQSPNYYAPATQSAKPVASQSNQSPSYYTATAVSQPPSWGHASRMGVPNGVEPWRAAETAMQNVSQQQSMTLWPEPVTPPVPASSSLDAIPDLPLPLPCCVRDVPIPECHPLSNALSPNVKPEEDRQLPISIPDLPLPVFAVPTDPVQPASQSLSQSHESGPKGWNSSQGAVSSGGSALPVSELITRSENQIVEWTVNQLQSTPSLWQPFVQGWMDDCGKEIFVQQIMTLPFPLTRTNERG